MKILVIEDNLSLSRNIIRYLSLKNIQAEASLDWKDWLYKASTKYYDAIVLDINLPEIDWLEVCKKLREKEKTTPIIMLTSMWSKDDIVTWLDIWADDYLVKPFDYEELLARLKSLVRRNLKNKSNFISVWEYTIDLDKVEVKKWKEEVKLSHLEFDLFKYLAQNKGRTVSRQELYEKVWGEFDWDFMFSKTVDVYIWYLRKKLDRDLIETKKWVGYMIK